MVKNALTLRSTKVKGQRGKGEKVPLICTLDQAKVLSQYTMLCLPVTADILLIFTVGFLGGGEIGSLGVLFLFFPFWGHYDSFCCKSNIA